MADNNTYGFDVSGLTAMKNALTTYKDSVFKLTSLGISADNIAKNIRGTEAQANLKKLSNAIFDKNSGKVYSLLSKLDKFGSALDEVKNQYSSKDKASTAFSGAVDSIKNMKS